MMHKIYAKHLPYKNGHYAKVYQEMTLNDDGPFIRVVKFEGDFCAVEGSHRLAACYSQGKTPRLIVLEPDVVVFDDNADWWKSIKPTLPCYEFNEVFTAYENNMIKKWENV